MPVTDASYEVDRGGCQTVGGFEDVAGAWQHSRAHRGQRFEMGADGAARRKVAAGRRQVRTAAPREQRTEQQHRTAQPADQRAVGLVLRHARDTARAASWCRCLRLRAPRSTQQPRHHLDIADPRHVGAARTPRSSAGRRRAAAAPRSCCLRLRRVPDSRCPPSISSVDIVGIR